MGCESSVMGCGIGTCVASGAMAGKMAMRRQREGVARRLARAVRPRLSPAETKA